MEFCRVRTFALVAVMLSVFSAAASAQVSVTVGWNANTEPDVTGYTVSWGTRPGVYTASADAGNNTQHSVSGLSADQRYYFVVQAYNADGLRSLPSNEVSNDALITFGSGSLPDQRPSIFWHNQATGQLMSWHLNGTAVIDTRTFSIGANPDTDWKVAGTGDLNGDRHPDMVWRHATEGWLAVWFLQNNMVIGTSYLSVNKMADLAWRIGGVGDMNADGFADLVWQNNDDGRLAIWYMRNEAVIASQVLALNVGPNSRWQIATIGDLNRDGAADIIWQTTDAWLAVWLQQSGNVQLTQYLSIPQMPDPGWRMVAAGYPGGSGTPAIVWRHSTRGDVAFWYMNGATVLSTIKTNPSIVQNRDWKIVGAR
jgi:hypothetical protein